MRPNCTKGQDCQWDNSILGSNCLCHNFAGQISIPFSMIAFFTFGTFCTDLSTCCFYFDTWLRCQGVLWQFRCNTSSSSSSTRIYQTDTKNTNFCDVLNKDVFCCRWYKPPWEESAAWWSELHLGFSDCHAVGMVCSLFGCSSPILQNKLSDPPWMHFNVLRTGTRVRWSGYFLEKLPTAHTLVSEFFVALFPEIRDWNYEISGMSARGL